jgi:hypothetical protein
MRGFLFVLVLILVGIAGLGYYQGWFDVSSDNADHKPNVTFTVDKEKFQQDKEKAQEKMHDLGPKAKDKGQEQERQP